MAFLFSVNLQSAEKSTYSLTREREEKIKEFIALFVLHEEKKEKKNFRWLHHGFLQKTLLRETPSLVDKLLEKNAI